MSHQRQKILYVITKSSWGGAQRYVYDLATSYASHYDVVVALGGNGPLKQRLIEAGIKTVSIENLQRDISFLKEIRAARTLWDIIKTEQPDIIHLNSSKAGALGVLLARLAGIRRIIFTAHGWAFNERRSFFSRMFLFLIHWCTVLMSHRTIAVSHKIKDQMKRALFAPNKIHIVHLGIRSGGNLSRADARKKLEELTHMSFDGMTVVGTIAELHPIKNYPMAIEAFSSFHAQYPKSIYLIMGDGEERVAIEQMIKERNLEQSIRLFGFVPDAADLLSALDIFLLTSHSEALGYVLLEAGLARVPIVATRVGGIPEIIANKDTGLLVQPGDSRGAAEALKTIANSAETSVRMADALSERIKAVFSLEKMIRETELLYK